MPSDATAACFYISNAASTFTNNVASGGFVGFAFTAHFDDWMGATKSYFTAMGLSPKWYSMVPAERPVVKFQHNYAHSSGGWTTGDTGAFASVYVGGLLHKCDTCNWNDRACTGCENNATNPYKYFAGRAWSWQKCTPDTCNEDDSCAANCGENKVLNENWGTCKATCGQEEVPHMFNDTTVWLSYRGFQAWNGKVVLDGWTSYDGTYEPTQILSSGAEMKNVYYKARSGNANSGVTRSLFFTMYDTNAQGIVSDVTVDGFSNADDMLISNFCFSDVTKPQHLNSYGGFKFVDTERHSVSVFKHDYEDYGFTGSALQANFYDRDGTITGLCEPSIVGGRRCEGTVRRTEDDSSTYPTCSTTNGWWNYDEQCKYIDGWRAWACPSGYGKYSIANLWFVADNILGESVMTGSGGDTLRNGSTIVETYTNDDVTSYSGCCFDGDHVAVNPIGKIYKFGSTEDFLSVTGNNGYTGPASADGYGWYLHLTNGPPPKLLVQVDQMTPGHKIVLAVSYPTTTTITAVAGKIFRGSSYADTSGCGNYGDDGAEDCTGILGAWVYHSFTLAESIEAMMASDNHYLYFWDSSKGHVYVKVDMSEIDNYPDVYTNAAHTADGMTLFPIAWKHEGGYDTIWAGQDADGAECNACGNYMVVKIETDCESASACKVDANVPDVLPNHVGLPAVDWTAAETATCSTTNTPTLDPTSTPTAHPTFAPDSSDTGTPTVAPTEHPTFDPSIAPTTGAPTPPTEAPTATPTTEAPTATPTTAPTAADTEAPTTAPTEATEVPTETPTAAPTVTCASWCAGNTNDWDTKCNWNKCAGCDDCATVLNAQLKLDITA